MCPEADRRRDPQFAGKRVARLLQRGSRHYCPRACSMASHVALEEAGALFEAKKVNIFTGEHLKPEYRAINPRAKVPVLRFDDGQVLLESTAILGWVGTAYPGGNLLGATALDRARTVATCAWLSGTVHPAFSRFVHPERVTAEVDSHAAVKAHAKESFWSYLREIDTMLVDRPWIADPYALVFYPWRRELGLPIGELTNLAAMKNRLVERPAARRALERERSVLLSMQVDRQAGPYVHPRSAAPRVPRLRTIWRAFPARTVAHSPEEQARRALPWEIVHRLDITAPP